MNGSGEGASKNPYPPSSSQEGFLSLLLQTVMDIVEIIAIQIACRLKTEVILNI